MSNQTRGGRINRINPLIQKIISSALLRSSDPILNKATITHVSTSPDLKKSMVFVSTLDGNEGSLKNSLEKNRIKIQKVLGREMTTRNVPKIKDYKYSKTDVNIKWYYDGTLNASANCIDRHLKKNKDKKIGRASCRERV